MKTFSIRKMIERKKQKVEETRDLAVGRRLNFKEIRVRILQILYHVIFFLYQIIIPQKINLLLM